MMFKDNAFQHYFSRNYHYFFKIFRLFQNLQGWMKGTVTAANAAPQNGSH